MGIMGQDDGAGRWYGTLVWDDEEEDDRERRHRIEEIRRHFVCKEWPARGVLLALAEEIHDICKLVAGLLLLVLGDSRIGRLRLPVTWEWPPLHWCPVIYDLRW